MNMNKSLERQAMETVERYGMLAPGERVIIALSGGADSMALLYFLLALRERLGLVLEAAHVNHLLRGEESDGDERFVRAVCDGHAVPLHVLRADVGALAQERGLGIEECGRRVRYDYLTSLGGKTATAHTLSDSVETVLYNLTRGAGLRGACGIPPVRGAVIRPLIDCTRDQVEAYCAENGIEYRLDSSNRSRAYTRNRIRLDVVPQLRQINPAMEDAFRRFLTDAREDEACLSCLAEEALHGAECGGRYDAQLLSALTPPVRRRALYRILYTHGGVMPERWHLLRLEEMLRSGGRASLNGGLDVAVSGGFLTFPAAEKEPETFCFPLRPGRYPIPGGEAEIILQSAGHKKFKNEVLDIAVDCDKINRKAVLRSRAPGDALQLAGRPRKSLKKLFNEAHIPPDARAMRVIAADEAGVLWAEGFGPDVRARLGAETRCFYQIRIWRNI